MSFTIVTGIKCCWAALFFLWLVSALFTKRTQRWQPSVERLAQVAIALPGAYLIAGALHHDAWLSSRFVPDTQLVAWTGLVLTITGTLFAAWARLTLGANWSGIVTVKEEHELVVRGPYALARHPIYTGILLALAGTLLINGQWRCIVGFSFIVVALAVKMRQEERLMTQTFPRAYPDYRRRVKALIPGVL